MGATLEAPVHQDLKARTEASRVVPMPHTADDQVLSSTNKSTLATMNEDATHKYEFPLWRASHCAWLMVCLIVACVFLGRTLHFEFDEMDYFVLPYLIENQEAPWNIFITRPHLNELKDGLYLPQTYEFISSVHTKLFGMAPYWHQLALGAWWAAALLFLFSWNRRDGRALAGVIAVLILLSMNAAWGVLLTRNSLILLCPILFQLAALYSLRRSVEASSVLFGFLFLFSFIAAAYANWQIVFSFPITALVLVLSTHHGSRVAKTTVTVFMFIVLIALLATSTIHTQPFNWIPPLFRHLPTQGEMLNGLAYPAQALLSQRLMVGLTLLSVTFALARSGLTGCVAIALSAPAIASIYFACRYYNIPVWAAYALGMAFYVNLLWITPWRRSLAVPLVWFLFSFVRGVIFTGGDFTNDNNIQQAMSSVFYLESGVALAWLLGVTLSNISAPGFACIQNLRPRFRDGWRILTALVVIVALPIIIIEAYKDFSQVVVKQEAEYHTPFKLAKKKLATDLLSIKDKTLVSYGGISLFHDLNSQIQLKNGPHDLDNKIPLEAYTGNTYFYGSSETYSGIYVENATPAAGIERDPFFMPRQWRSFELNTKDVYNPEPLAELSMQNEPIAVSQKTLAPSATVVGHTDFVITGWATSDAWQNVGILTLTMRQYDREFIWDKITLVDAVPGSNARRFVINAFDATILRTPEHVAQTIELNWGLNPRADFEKPAGVTIDRATLYIPKP